MIERRIEPELSTLLRRFPVVGLVGARQAGKTTIARAIARRRPRALYLDLERPSDAARLADAEFFLEPLADRLIILDEIQRMPSLFPVLRSLVDARRRSGRFLILGSASPDLSRQSSESLAGRIAYRELAPFTLEEIAPQTRPATTRLWNRGGFPGSFLARSDALSLEWRNAFIDTHLQRDLPGLGMRVAGTAMRRFWEMLAHFHGQIWNASKIAASLGVSAPTAAHYLETLQDTFMARALPPCAANVKKRLVKSPKVYLRDSGLLHALLRIADVHQLLGHPIAGASWEGWVIEQALAADQGRSNAGFYRTAAGAEIDLVLERAHATRLAFEIKLGTAPALTRGFWTALEDLRPEAAYVVYAGNERYRLGPGVEALPVSMLAGVVRA